MSNTNLSGEDLLKEARRLQATAGKSTYDRKKKEDQSSLGRLRGDITEFSMFFNQLVKAGSWIYGNVIKPAASCVPGPAKAAVLGYKHQIWDRLVYAKDQYDTPYFSKKRAAGVLAATFLAAACLPTVTTLGIDTALYATTVHKNEVLYLYNSQEIFPEKNIHSIQGCIDAPCTPENSLYFRSQPRLFNHIWSILDHGGFYYPDYVAGAVPPVMSKCEVTTYGIRFKPFIDRWDIYPDVLTAACQPIDVKGGAHLAPIWTAPADTRSTAITPAP